MPAAGASGPTTVAGRAASEAPASMTSTRTPSARIADRRERGVQEQARAEAPGVPEPIFEDAHAQPSPARLRDVTALMALADGVNDRRDDDSMSHMSSASRAPHLVARDAELAEANLSLFACAFDDAGIERLVQMNDFSADDLVVELRTCAKERGLALRRAHEASVRALHRRWTFASAGAEAPASAPTESGPPKANDEPCNAPAAVPAPEPAVVAKTGAFAKKQAKAQRKKQNAAEAAAAAPETAAVQSTRTSKAKANPLDGVPRALAPDVSDVLRGSAGLSAPDVLDPFASDIDEGSEAGDINAPPEIARGLPLLSRVFELAYSPDGGRSPESFVDSFFELARAEPTSGDPEIKGEDLELMLRQCKDDGAMRLSGDVKCARSMRMEFKRAWNAVQAKQSASADTRSGATDTTRLDQMAQKRAAEEQRQREQAAQAHQSMAAQGAAMVAAMAGASSTSDKAEQDAPRERIARVARDSDAARLLATLRAHGEAALTSQAAEAIADFLKLQADAQVDNASIAELLHTSNLPTPSGVLADPDVAIGMLSGSGARDGAHLVQRAAVARDAVKTQAAIVGALAFQLDMHIKSGEASRMASAIFYGTLVPVTTATGVFKMAEMSSDRALGLLLPSANSPEEAKATITALINPLSIVMRKAHPRDRSIEDTLSSAMAESIGPKENKCYHNSVFGELFKHYAKCFAKWREGELMSMPVLSSSFTKAMNNPRLRDVVSGNAERDAATADAVARAEKAEAAAKEAFDISTTQKTQSNTCICPDSEPVHLRAKR